MCDAFIRYHRHLQNVGTESQRTPAEVYIYMDCIASLIFVYSQYLENCLHFGEKLLLPVLLDLRPIADGSVCPSVKGALLSKCSTIYLPVYYCDLNHSFTVVGYKLILYRCIN